jgi:hypothetical protein
LASSISPQCRLADLPHAARRPVELLDGHRLDRVDHDDRWLCRPRGLDDRADLARRQDGDGVGGRSGAEAEPPGPQADLAGGFLAGCIQHAAVRGGNPAGDLEQ